MAVKLPDFDQWIDAMAPVLGLSVAAERRAGVKGLALNRIRALSATA